MAEATLNFTLGGLEFGGTGSEEWLAKQLDKVIAAAPTLSELKLQHKKSQTTAAEPDGDENAAPFTDSLAAHIKAKGGETNQVKRFLATADWLRRKGSATLTTAAVSKALTENHQKKLSNPADCLSKNVTKGFCEKAVGGFYITPDGLKDLGYSS